MNLQSDRQSFFASVHENLSRIIRQAGPYMAASYTLMGAIVGLSLLGYFADTWLKTTPWLLLLGIILGLVIGLYEMAKVVLKK